MSAPAPSQAMAILGALAQALAESSDANALLAAVHAALERALAATEVVLATQGGADDDADLLFHVRDGKAASGLPRRLPREVLGPAAAVLETGRPLRAGEHAGEGPWWLGVPLTAMGTTFGVLGVARPAPFTADDDALLALAGHLVAFAVYASRLQSLLLRDRGNLDAALEQLVVGDPLRALGRMAAGVAHDVNNTLAAILLRTEILAADLTDPRLARHVTTVQALAREGGDIVRRLHEFARARTTRAFDPIDLNQVIDEALELTRSRWKGDTEGRGRAWQVRTDKAVLPPVAGEAPALREALMHIVFNALDAMPDGGHLTLRTVHEDDRVLCQVEDSGRGMSEEVQQRAAEPFFTTTGEPGRGLGLTIVHGVMARHGGQLELRSEPGRGTVVTLRFPATDVVPAAGPARRPGRRAKVLVVDDDAFVRQVVIDILEQQGHEVVACADGRAAVERARAESFDLVLTDLGLPGLSGWDVARSVKAAGGPPVVLMTGWSDQVDETRARANGVDLVLSKPIAAATLQGLIGSLGGGLRPPSDAPRA